MSGTYAPNPALQFLDNNGDPAASYQLFTYLAGTSTKTSTYTDVDLTSANANPIVLDSAGRCTIFLVPGVSYKFVLATDTDTDPPASPVWTRDNITAVPENELQATIDGTAGHALAANDCVYLSAGDGSRTAGRWYKADADNDYSSSTADGLGFVTAAATTGDSISIVRMGRVTGLSGLTAGTLYYISATAGGLTSSAPTNARAVAVADSATSIVVIQSTVPNVWTNLPDASATVEGIVTTTTQTFAGDKVFTGNVLGRGLIGWQGGQGVGGSVTQLTDKSTGVTLNKVCGSIVTTSAALAAGAEVSFTVTNSTVTASDVVIVNIRGGGTTGAYSVGVHGITAGSFVIVLSNLSTGSLSEALTLSFAVINAADD